MAKRTDENHKRIVQGLRTIGAEVQSIASIGAGCPDVLVGFRGIWHVAEIKDGTKSPSRQRLTDDEKWWHERFSRVAPVHVWTSLEDALTTIGAI